MIKGKNVIQDEHGKQMSNTKAHGKLKRLCHRNALAAKGLFDWQWNDVDHLLMWKKRKDGMKLECHIISIFFLIV